MNQRRSLGASRLANIHSHLLDTRPLVMVLAFTGGLALGCSSDLGHETVGSETSPIVGGTKTTNGDRFPQAMVNVAGCTGTIIDSRHVLSAAHCGINKGMKVNFYDGHLPNGLSRTVERVYRAADLSVDPTTGAAIDSAGDIADWTVLRLDAPVPSNSFFARLASTLIPVNTKVYEVGTGEHDGLSNPTREMRLRVAATTPEVGPCPLPMPPSPLPCRGSVFASGFGNPGDSGGPLFTYANDANKALPLTVHGAMLTGDARYSSTATHFARIAASIGLSEQRGDLLGGTNLGSAFPSPSARECAATCISESACNGYRFASGSCQLKLTGGLAVAGGSAIYAVRHAANRCAETDALCGIGVQLLDQPTPAVAIGPAATGLEYFECATEGGTCALGGKKYVAYGANGRFVFGPVTGNLPCRTTTFGSDPAPGHVKKCYFANYGFAVNEGATTTFRGNVAYGSNGKFNFRTMNGSFQCNNATFGGDPTPNVRKDCYVVQPDDYSLAVEENGSLPTGSRIPVMYGANGKFVYGLLTGSATCTSTTFGRDPTPGVVKACYRMSRTYLTEENQNFSFSSDRTIRFGTGFNGNFLQKVARAGACSTATFPADPHPSSVKRCYQ